ncbi:Alkaline phosphatase synthesis sensor protein PhoR [bacterium HR39]|nr:Alkaline phosphatase synthesis sensor protein PhoR [bacterium HR39]
MLLRSLPVAAAGLPAVLAVALFGGTRGFVLALPVLAGLSLLAGWIRARRELELGAWLAGLAQGERPPRPEGFDEWIDRLVAAPVLRLARELIRSRRRLSELREALSQMVEGLPDPILFVDAHFEVAHANAAARARFAPDLAEERRVPLFLLFRDPELHAAVEELLARRGVRELDLALPGDPVRRYHARVASLHLPDSGERGVVLVLREIGEQLAIERMRSDFVANASHELRTPISALLAAVETLKGPARDDPKAREEFLELVEREVRRMARLVDDLLQLSRIEASVPEPPTTPCDLVPLVERVMAELRPQAEKAGVEPVVDMPEPLPELVADPEQIHQLLANLVDNAIRHGGSGGRVEVRVSVFDRAPPEAGPLAGRPAVALCVRDWGPGIPAEHIPRLTERFYRVDRARSRASGGTGLGLAIVKHVLRRHRGHLAVDSEPGRGSTFCAFLPLVRPAAEERPGDGGAGRSA